MAHRAQQKEAARQARLRSEARARRVEHRQRLLRRSGYGAIAAIAAVLVAIATIGRGSGQAPAGQMTATGGSGPAIGAAAPNFSLENAVSGQRVTLASLRGHKTLMFFSEGVNCQACLVQAGDLQKNSALRDAGIRLVSVTTDSPTDLAQAAKQYGITTPLLSDPTTEMSNAYGMLGHGGMEHPTQDGHAFMLIGADGRVLWHQAYQSMYVQPGQLMHDIGTNVKS